MKDRGAVSQRHLLSPAPGCFKMNEVQDFEIASVCLVLTYVSSWCNFK